MDQKRRRYWGNYLRSLADRMELRDWSINTPPEQTREGCGASVECVIGRKIACIKFASDFDDDSPERQRHYCVHELIHVHLWGVTQAMRDVRENVSKEWVRQLELRVHLAEEYGVDALASTIAPFLHLPPTGKDKKRKKVKDA